MYWRSGMPVRSAQRNPTSVKEPVNNVAAIDLKLKLQIAKHSSDAQTHVTKRNPLKDTYPTDGFPIRSEDTHH